MCNRIFIVCIAGYIHRRRSTSVARVLVVHPITSVLGTV